MSDEIQRYDLHGPDWGLNVCEVEPDNDGEFILYSDHLARIRKLEAQLAAARKFPDDGPARPQLEPPASQNDEARRWAKHADWLERSYIAQNLAWGELEREKNKIVEMLDKWGVTSTVNDAGIDRLMTLLERVEYLVIRVEYLVIRARLKELESG